MRKNKANEVLSFLSENASESFSAKELSEKLNISERMIRNYIRQLNESSKKAMILSDGGKYRIDPSFDHNHYETEHPDLSNQERVMVILSRLLTAEEAIDLFDLADELYVSESTIEADLKKVRRRLEPFHLSLSYDHGKLMIQGSEKDRRSFTSYMITNTRYKGFMFNDTKHFLNDEYQISFIKENLVRIFNECYFFFNDYSLNNIILHIIITIDRLKNNCYLEETPFNLNISEIENKAAAMIVGFLEENYDVKVSKAEANNIASFLSCNLATLDYRMIHPDNIETYISHETVELVRYILNKITDFYQIDSFDDVFFARFSLHVDNLLKRQSAHFSVHNPMQMDIKYSYPLIFDIAVYAASLIKEKTSYEINQDEISLIALHIGSFIESNDSNKSKISAVYVYADYHQFYQQNITKIQHRFENDLNLMYTISIIDLKSLQQKPDLLISEVSIEGAIQV
ncbi:MAG: transcription antiterminator, partial [Erysipelotrichaceae bacterium]|nr:transcription antiterminator [Erysipelotrichaceae bacterium]